MINRDSQHLICGRTLGLLSRLSQICTRHRVQSCCAGSVQQALPEALSVSTETNGSKRVESGWPMLLLVGCIQAESEVKEEKKKPTKRKSSVWTGHRLSKVVWQWSVCLEATSTGMTPKISLLKASKSSN
ncbi:hypothetical protein PGT21_012082 [Puccinia graminis f. sp. tritici]|uniref:Uncharacterized protein n=1 Tax=Puccinia graminis f. sp. tritici TaxID=56615 RepID=A0A5B0MK04_PUCGR|nr:hypothetical protein PGT21_012082 [Puccinia graminis f. sp. tritici]